MDIGELVNTTRRKKAFQLLYDAADKLERYTNNSEEVTEIVDNILTAALWLDEELENA